MMKLIRKSFLYLFIGALVSCVQDELPNAEADLLTFEFPSEVLKRVPIVENEKVTVYVKAGVDLTQLAPIFTITDGATCVPKSGVVLDFTHPQTFVVTSQSQQWSKTYTVECKTAELVSHYSFENVSEGDFGGLKYPVLFETKNGEKTMEWASGNSGFAFTANGAPAADYPTYVTEDGQQGKGAKLVTRSTGALGAMFSSPMAAGNLYLGAFQLNAMAPLKSTHFGVPFEHVPNRLEGYYKYKSGTEFTTYTTEDGYQKNPIIDANKKDIFDIYGVLYETTDELQFLDGENVLTHPNIVAIARLNEGTEADEWTKFSIPFVLQEGKTIDAEKLKEGKYNITVVFSSSKDGALFNGAVGSTLCVDEVNLISEKEEL